MLRNINKKLRVRVRQRIRLLKSVGLPSLRKLELFRKYLSSRRVFEEKGGVVSHLYPVLTDSQDFAGDASGHYFHQDLLVASMIHKKNPERHIDVGSSIPGFVAHVASFRKIEILDIRELGETGHPQIEFLQRDLMVPDRSMVEIADSVSCLHTIEHFGLGRYGDPIDPEGYLKGVENIIAMLKPGGLLYISFPIGRDNEVHFNAHRVFHPRDIFGWPAVKQNLNMTQFDFVDDEGLLHRDFPLKDVLPEVDYGCGIYTFVKAGNK
jgi:hypothetical protein